MKTTQSRSFISELILACFILSVFLLLENNKESQGPIETKNQASKNTDQSELFGQERLSQEILGQKDLSSRMRK